MDRARERFWRKGYRAGERNRELERRRLKRVRCKERKSFYRGRHERGRERKRGRENEWERTRENKISKHKYGDRMIDKCKIEIFREKLMELKGEHL